MGAGEAVVVATVTTFTIVTGSKNDNRAEAFPASIDSIRYLFKEFCRFKFVFIVGKRLAIRPTVVDDVDIRHLPQNSFSLTGTGLKPKAHTEHGQRGAVGNTDDIAATKGARHDAGNSCSVEIIEAIRNWVVRTEAEEPIKGVIIY